MESYNVISVPFEDSPIWEVNEHFRLSDFSQLCGASFSLIEKLHSMHVSLRQRFRIQLIVQKDVWKLQLCLDPTVWYLSKRVPSDIENCGKEKPHFLKEADSFMTWVYENSDKCPEPTDKISLPTLCHKPPPCPNPSCTFDHIIWQCPAEVPHKMKENTECKFQCRKSLLFTHECEEIKKSGWVILRRPEKTRDLVISPCPKEISENLLPHNNEDLISCDAFWDAVKTFIQHLDENCAKKSVERVVINFGSWESAVHRDVYLKECHAHAHFWLSSESVRVLGQMDGCDFPPNDYLWLNAVELQKTVLWNDQRLHKEQYLKYLDRKIDNKFENLDKKIDQQNDFIQSQFTKLFEKLERQESK